MPLLFSLLSFPLFSFSLDFILLVSIFFFFNLLMIHSLTQPQDKWCLSLSESLCPPFNNLYLDKRQPNIALKEDFRLLFAAN